MITAHFPQAKGRIERLFGTLQDRLVKTLRQANASTVEEANAVLAAYLPAHNARFARPAADPTSAFRPWPKDWKAESGRPQTPLSQRVNGNFNRPLF